MSEEVCEMQDLGLSLERSGHTLIVSDTARTAFDPTDEVTMTIDTRFLSEVEISDVLDLVDEAFSDIREKSHQKENLILNDSSLDSTKFFREVLKIDAPAMMKIVIAISGRLAVKSLGLSTVLELLDAKMRDHKGEPLSYWGTVAVDCPELYLFILPGMTIGGEVFFDRQKANQEEIETVFQTDDIVQIISFAMQNSSSITLEKYLSSGKSVLEKPTRTISALCILAIARLVETSRKELNSFTSDQLCEFLALVELCELESYSIETLLIRFKLHRIAWPCHSRDCQECLVPFFTVDEMSKLDSEAKNSNLGRDAEIFSSHLESPADFLFVDLAVRKGISRFIEFCAFVAKLQESIPDWEFNAELGSFQDDFEKYLIEISREISKTENDNIPIAWIAEMSEHQLPDYFFS